MTVPAKLGLGVLALGTVSGVSYLGSTYFLKNEEEVINQPQQKPAISELIKQEFKYILLSTQEGGENKDQTQWTANWNSYKSTNTAKVAGADELNLDGWVVGGTTDLTEVLKKKCTELSQKTDVTIGSDLYAKIITYCGRQVTIADEAGKDELKIASTENTDDDATIWQPRIAEVSKLPEKLTALSIENSDLNTDKLKTGCRNAKIKKKQESNYQNIYEAYKTVCTKE